MSIKNVEGPFSIDDGTVEEFTGIRELGFNDHGAFVVSAHTTPVGTPRGTYFTSLPISPKEYRRTHASPVAYRRARGRLTVWSDWGRAYVFRAAPGVLDALVADCVANEVPRSDED